MQSPELLAPRAKIPPAGASRPHSVVGQLSATMRHVGVEGRGHCLWFFATRKGAALTTAGAYVSIGFEELPTTGTSQRQALRRYAALRASSLDAVDGSSTGT